MSGYLFKRSHNNTFKKWNRRWFTLINSRLFYQRKNDYNEVCQIEPDLRVCKIREVNDAERRFTFEIVSPKCKHLLQADSQRECAEWVRNIDYAINYALHNTYKQPSATSSSSSSTSQNGSGESSMNGGGDGGMNTSETNGDLIDAIEFFNMMGHEASSAAASSVFVSCGSNTGGGTGTMRPRESHFYGSKTDRSADFARKKSEQSERKCLILNVKGNQNCCDCGAPNPNWVTAYLY